MSEQREVRTNSSSVPDSRSVSATEAQNNFGRVLARAASEGAIVIRKYDRPTAVLLSLEQYRRLTEEGGAELEELTREFDEMLARMQSEQATAATDALFEMGADELGQAAVRGARDESD